MGNRRHSEKVLNKFSLDLNANNIHINTVNTGAFFGSPDLPAPVVSSVILNHVNRPPATVQLSRDDRVFFHYLHDTTLNEGWIDDFSRHLLSPILGLEDSDPVGRIVYPRLPLPFFVNNRKVYATPNCSLLDLEGYILLLVETAQSETLSRGREESRLVASAIGAFTRDNSRRAFAGLPPMTSKRYIGIVMIKSAPHFYKITITQALVNAVRTSQTPAEETIIERFIPTVPNMDNYLDEGMAPLENRRICFQCFEAMKGLL